MEATLFILRLEGIRKTYWPFHLSLLFCQPCSLATARVVRWLLLFPSPVPRLLLLITRLDP